jgi:hypothetical protein
VLPDAPSLRHAAHLLGTDAGWLAEQHDWLTRTVRALPDTGFRGAAAQAAVARMLRLTTPLGAPAEQMLRVAQVLSMTATLQEELDALARRAVRAVEGVPGAEVLLTLLLRDLRALGDLLDHVCARQIDLLCTPLPAEPPSRLGDTPDLGLDAVHELTTLTSGLELPPDVRLLEVGEGRLVAAVGDVETAPAVTTLVPGVGSSDPAGLPVHLDRARTVAQVTGGAAVVWLGYPAPAGLAPALAQGPARAAGAELQLFQRELARRHPAQRRIVVGHSYGSVVAGKAASARGGLYADDLVLLGSPGAGVGSAAEMTLLGDDPQVHAMTHPGDPIGLVAGTHGTDPTTPGFGARVWPGDREGGHSSYWSDPVLLGLLKGWAQKKPRASSE